MNTKFVEPHEKVEIAKIAETIIGLTIAEVEMNASYGPTIKFTNGQQLYIGYHDWPEGGCWNLKIE